MVALCVRVLVGIGWSECSGYSLGLVSGFLVLVVPDRDICCCASRRAGLAELAVSACTKAATVGPLSTV